MADYFILAQPPGAAMEEGTTMKPKRIWIEQCEAARGTEDEFGTQKALDHIVGEKFINFLEAAETHAGFRAEVPAFAAEIKTIFEPWQLAKYLEKARQSEPFDAGIYEDDIHRCASDLLLVEQAREWLLGNAY
jgi:hypothetical protein